MQPGTKQRRTPSVQPQDTDQGSQQVTIELHRPENTDLHSGKRVWVLDDNFQPAALKKLVSKTIVLDDDNDGGQAEPIFKFWSKSTAKSSLDQKEEQQQQHQQQDLSHPYLYSDELEASTENKNIMSHHVLQNPAFVSVEVETEWICPKAMVEPNFDSSVLMTVNSSHVHVNLHCVCSTVAQIHQFVQSSPLFVHTTNNEENPPL